MPSSIHLAAASRALSLFRHIHEDFDASCVAVATWWQRLQAAGDYSALRQMSDRELTDLAIGRGELDRDR